MDVDVFRFDLELVYRDVGDSLGDRIEVAAGVHQGAQRHVARDAGEAIEVRDAH